MYIMYNLCPKVVLTHLLRRFLSSLYQEKTWSQISAKPFLEIMLINHGLEPIEQISIKYFAGFAHFHCQKFNWSRHIFFCRCLRVNQFDSCSSGASPLQYKVSNVMWANSWYFVDSLQWFKKWLCTRSSTKTFLNTNGKSQMFSFTNCIPKNCNWNDFQDPSLFFGASLWLDSMKFMCLDKMRLSSRSI